ncbi:two-component sensor histidine kinase [Sphingomonas naasensis]|uniref:histidine kinase n=1 Tax=Sphingomonas naasensis TaxID=1344951 RepID=A0A4S1W5M8_9SPHN|nr:sensor histidine kinase [Sphingomonas naasensis]NIJ20673.1 two-component sensor histidine kinase [Sphingomonas naasensis]TGX37603.1 sensor histidine kinase [Sphingomonas naasensis]
MMAQHAFPEPAAIAVLPAMPQPSVADETNHRVANSLQLLAAMVSVEARRVADPIAVAALDTTMRRILAIGGVHRQLYQSGTAASVDLRAYLGELGAELERGCADAGRRVHVAADTINASPDAATAIGVIVSELVGNACKYAYAPGMPGDVEVVLRKMPFGGYRLEVSDRGRGMPADRISQGSGLGRQLIAMMAKRLGGRHDWTNTQPGTRFTLHVGGC